MTSELMVNVGYVLFGAGGLGGVWLLVHEWSYARDHPGSDLAGVLQVVGLVLMALAAGGLVAIRLLARVIVGATDGAPARDRAAS